MTNYVLFYETKHLRNLILMINSQLETLIEEAMQTEDPDSYGYFDSAEHLTGLGFVTCQTYMTACYGIIGIKKPKALSIGFKHQSGLCVAEIINNAANYWKHNNEWPNNKNNHHKLKVSETFDSIGFPVDGEYPLGGILTELSLPHTASFEAILNKLENWASELQQQKHT